MKLSDLNIGDVCFTMYNQGTETSPVNAVSVVVDSSNDTIVFDDLIMLSPGTEDDNWDACHTDTTVKFLFHHEEEDGDIMELLFENCPEYSL